MSARCLCWLSPGLDGAEKVVHFIESLSLEFPMYPWENRRREVCDNPPEACISSHHGTIDMRIGACVMGGRFIWTINLVYCSDRNSNVD